MKFKVPVQVLTTSTEKFIGKDGSEVSYGVYIVTSDEEQLIRGTCSSELADALSEYKGLQCKLVYEFRVDTNFKPKLSLVGIE